MRLQISSLETPIGLVTFASRGASLVALGFDNQWPDLRIRLERRFGALTPFDEQTATGIGSAIAAYFRGDIRALDELSVDPGGTPFQGRVWAALRAIPPGTTISYSELATTIGTPKAVRAVGAANGENPISLVIPCHRVVGKTGHLTGYAGGLTRKGWLLTHEAACIAAAQDAHV
jgi:methylated-DNA-[protein]-cysteine S-methyltransferase